ncbi:MAG: phosphoglycerate dehydrogenase [Anaerolineaceae bacterium]|nr:phosphoglycerate dehydrogenase [Anaerolineaceae bacterium]
MDLKQYTVLVTPTSYAKSDPRLKTRLEGLVGKVIYNPTGKPLTSAEVAALLPQVDGYIAGLDGIDRSALATADRLKVIARYGVGVDCVDLSAAKEKGIIVTNTPGANSVSVAELAIALMLSLVRQIPEAVNATRQGKWPRLSGISLEGKTIGIIGLGAIGKLLAQRLAGFACRLLAYDPYPDLVFAADHQVALLPLEEILRQADLVSLNMPLLPETFHLVDESFLARMKKGAYLVNTARGEIIDEHALLAALQSGHLRGVALDAFSVEPPDPSDPLLALPQVITTPHLGAQTDGATNNMGWIALEECLAVLRGETPKHRVI